MIKRGFTLVEILVVIAVLSLVGILVLTIFTRTLRGTNKAQILGVIKQNGQSVLETLTSKVRNADDVVCPFIPEGGTSVTADTMVIVSAGIYTRYEFIEPGAGNGFIQQDNPEKVIIPETGEEETDWQFVNRICGAAGQVYVSPLILTDTNTQSGVSLTNGSFTRDKLAGFRDNVTVTFKLNPGVDALPVVAGEIDPVTFETTIQLR